MQHPLSQGQDAAQNPLAQSPENQAQNLLTQNDQINPLAQGMQTQANPLTTPALSSNALSGVVTAPLGVIITNALVIACPYSSVDQNACPTALIDEKGYYILELPKDSYLMMAAIEVSGDGQVNSGDYVSYQNVEMDGQAVKTLNFALEPYRE